jgi:hypothetical protein
MSEGSVRMVVFSGVVEAAVTAANVVESVVVLIIDDTSVAGIMDVGVIVVGTGASAIQPVATSTRARTRNI